MDVKASAKQALARLLEPLANFVFDSGLSIKELHALLRTAAVRSVAARQLQTSDRVSISGISASTGISRAEVSKILNSAVNANDVDVDRYQHSTNRIVSAWHDDPRFTTPSGQPADLKIYGRGSTFESLVKMYGKGIPTRAMLDELSRTRAIELKSSQVVRVRTRMIVDRGKRPQAIKAFGDRVTELMMTLQQNMGDPENPTFVATVPRARVAVSDLPLLRREISSRSADFLSQMHDMLIRNTSRRELTGKNLPSLSVTIFLHEEPAKSGSKAKARFRRKNLRRAEL